MHGNWKGLLIKMVACLGILALLPAGVGHTQAPQPPQPAAPFEGVMPDSKPAFSALSSPPLGEAFHSGTARLSALQNNDGGWDWPLDDGNPATGSAMNTLGPIAMGLGKAFAHDANPDALAALQDAGALLLTKSGNFSPSDGYLAAELDTILGGTTYTDYLNAHFYDLLAAGTYYRSTAPVGPYTTQQYVDRIRTSRSGTQANLAAWDIGIGLVGAAKAGVSQTELNIWIAATEAEINELDGTQYYDVIGLAGAVYGLAYVGEDFDPTAGQHAAAASLSDLGEILASYQLNTGAFTWNSLAMGEGEGNEAVQETAYAIIALSQLDRSTYLPAILSASDYLESVQLGTGGWEGFTGDGENNEVTGEALWALDTGYPLGDVWVCPTGDCGHPEAYYNTVQDGVDNVASAGTVHVLPGTYVEQVNITSRLTLFAEDSDPSLTVIQSPNTLAACWGTKKTIICVENTQADILGFTVDGAGKGNVNNQFIGIGYHNAAGTVQNNVIKDVRNTPLDGAQGGVGFYALNEDATARTIDVLDNEVYGYQKGAIVLNGTNLTGHANDNVTTGAGATPLTAQNGIQFGFGAGGTALTNTVTGNAWTGTYGGSNDPFTDPNADGAAGILLYQTGSAVEIGGNTLTGNQFGVGIWDGAAVDIHDNDITGLAHTGSAWPVGVALWSSTDTAITVSNNTIDTHEYGLLVQDSVAGAPVPSATASGNTFTHNHVQVASTNGTVTIPSTLSGNTFDLAVTVSGGSYLPFIWSHIQDGVNAASAGNVVHVNPGTYVENVTIPTALELAGTSQAATIVQPALSNPNCGGAGGGSLCTGASNVILVQANDVTIHDLTVDGDNPALASAYDANGVNLDARNGIITNHAAGVFNNLDVHAVTVRNIYLRGLYASSGGSFDFDSNTVTNVDADPSSIAMMAFGGTGTFSNNTVSYANDGIVANWSNGIQFLDNTVTHSGGGVHTDNAGDGVSTSDLIQGNTISDCKTDGFGIFVFMPYKSPTVNDNTVTNCKVGLSVWGQAAAVTSTFTNNTVDGNGLPGSIGARISTDLADVYTEEDIDTDITVTFTGNTFTNNATGVLLSGHATEPGTHVLNATFHCNSIEGNTVGATTSGFATFTNDFADNYWGAHNGPSPVGSGDSAAAGINYTPWSWGPSCSNTVVYIAGSLHGEYNLAAGDTVLPSYSTVQNGPVEVMSATNIIPSERGFFGPYNTFNEVIGYPDNQMTNHYWFPWYDNKDMITWVLVGNPSKTADAHVTIKIAGAVVGTYTIPPFGNVTPTFGTIQNGPVEVLSDINVFSSERTLLAYPDGAQSFNEVMGYPHNQLTNHYWFPWYDQKDMRTWVLVGNPNSNKTAHVTIKIAGTRVGTYTIAPFSRIIPTFPGVQAGPVEVTSDINVFTSERSLFGESPNWTFNEVMGFPHNQLTNDYWFPWYDNKDMITWVLVGNPSSTITAHAIIKIDGVEVGTYTIPPFGNVTPTFTDAQAGPVEVISDIPVFTSERALQGYPATGTSFNEMMGIANSKLTDHYWFTWYDNKDMITKIVIAKP